MTALGSTLRRSEDRELAERSGKGDREAFAALYERNFQQIYDFTLRVVRDRELAADVVQTTFLKAWTAFQEQKEVQNIKSWLFTIAHNSAIDELRQRKRLVHVGDDETVFTQVDPSRLSDPEAALGDKELAELVWSSAAALNPQEYALLDLHLRRGFDADELAETLGLQKGAVYTRLSRLKDSFEESVTSALLMRRGRRDCPELDSLLEARGTDELTPALRAEIQQHLKGCERCQESKSRYVSPVELFAGLAPVPLDPALMAAVWKGIEAGIGGLAGGGGNGSGPSPDQGVGHRLAIGTGAGIAVIAVVAGVVVASRGGGRVADPADVHSASHRIAQPSTNNVVAMRWSRRSRARGYSVQWSRDAKLPDRVADLPGSATGTKSPALAPGDWYFVLRTEGPGGRWTSTVVSGPYRILSKPSRARPRSKGPRKAKQQSRPGEPARTTTGPSVTPPTSQSQVPPTAKKKTPRKSGPPKTRRPPPPPSPQTPPPPQTQPPPPPPPPQPPPPPPRPPPPPGISFLGASAL